MTKRLTKKEDKIDLSKLPSTSACIRYLSAKGFTRSQIAKDFGLTTKAGQPIRYQHVRNVLDMPLVRDKK